jgi:hypothetical protein
MPSRVISVAQMSYLFATEFTEATEGYSCMDLLRDLCNLCDLCGSINRSLTVGTGIDKRVSSALPYGAYNYTDS